MKAQIKNIKVMMKFTLAVGVLATSLSAHADGAGWVANMTKGSLATQQPGEPDAKELIDSAYTTATLLTRALEQSTSIPLGQRIIFFRKSISAIIEKSGQNPTEEPVRLTLQRAQEVIDPALQIASEDPQQNQDSIAQWGANFYKNSFELAVAFVNNPSVIVTKDNESKVVNYYKRTSIAQFGYYFSTLLWRDQSNLTSDSSKAYILVKMLGYLGQDFNNDLRRNQGPFKETMADIYQIQANDVNYSNIIHSFSLEERPNAKDVTGLRVKVYKVWSAVPAKLGAVGLPTDNPSR